MHCGGLRSSCLRGGCRRRTCGGVPFELLVAAWQHTGEVGVEGFDRVHRQVDVAARVLPLRPIDKPGQAGVLRDDDDALGAVVVAGRRSVALASTSRWTSSNQCSAKARKIRPSRGRGTAPLSTSSSPATRQRRPKDDGRPPLAASPSSADDLFVLGATRAPTEARPMDRASARPSCGAWPSLRT